jgi:hypothetical protein
MMSYFLWIMTPQVWVSLNTGNRHPSILVKWVSAETDVADVLAVFKPHYEMRCEARQ